MPVRAIFKSVVLDILAGFVALCLLFAYLVVHPRNDLQLFALATAVLFFLAGMLRGASRLQNSWVTGVQVGLAGVIPVVAMRVTGAAMTEQGTVSLFIVFSLALAIAGVETRKLLSCGRCGAASLLVLASFGAVALVVAAVIPTLAARWASMQVDRSVPSFSFAALDGKAVTSAELHGHVVVLAFWGTWCPPCRQELPALQKTFEQYNGNADVAFYAVGGPWGDDTAEKESAFAKQISLTMPLAFASRGTARMLGVNEFPTLIVLDRAGRVRMIHTGYDASEHLGQNVSKEIVALEGK